MDFNNISKVEDLDEAYPNFENSIIKIIDKRAPIKRRKQIHQPDNIIVFFQYYIFLAVVAFVG
jgi:hypothetical protein